MADFAKEKAEKADDAAKKAEKEKGKGSEAVAAERGASSYSAWDERAVPLPSSSSAALTQVAPAPRNNPACAFSYFPRSVLL
jgi:hypothetical protein